MIINPGAPRIDIQALRGLAVLIVVLYHTKLAGITGGYLGVVDIFFVVSGFLITRLIAKGVSSESFSLGTFYMRRADACFRLRTPPLS